MEISRREFLKYLGVTTAGMSLYGLGCDSKWSVPDELYERVGGAPRLESWKTSVCTLCSGGCGIKARLIDGIPVRVQGNPLHPVNQGGICPMAESGVELLFNPDRIKQPLQRNGARGDDQWQPVSWEQALQTVVARLKSLRENGKPHQLAFLTGSQNNLLVPLFERFMAAYGSPNFYTMEDFDSAALATYVTQGHKTPYAFNFKETELLINFGADLLDEGPSPVRFNQLYAELRNREAGKRARIVHVDSRLSRTAANSDEWVAVRPGSMAALALGMANVLIKDKQLDERFISTNSFGFEDWKDGTDNTHRGFKTLVSEEYYPEKVADLTGVAAARIVRLARRFGSVDKAVVLAGTQAAKSSNGLYTLWAIDCLNALKGNLNNSSPVSFAPQPPFASLPDLLMDAASKRGYSQPKLVTADQSFCLPEHALTALINQIRVKKPYPTDTLFIENTNPAFNTIGQSDLIDAFNEIPFIVSFSSFVDETSLYADLILPAHSMLERYEVVHSTPSVHFAHVGIQQPVIAPLHDTRHPGDVILQIARELGGPMAAGLQWKQYDDYLQVPMLGVYKTGSGTVFTERMDEAWLKFLKERGWQAVRYSTFEEFWKVAMEKGGWWDPFPSGQKLSSLLRTPSGKFEFYSQVLERQIRLRTGEAQPSPAAVDSLLKKWHIQARGDLVFLPHYEAPRVKDKNGMFPHQLLTFQVITNINGAGGNQPLSQELFGLLCREYWQSWVELNPETAHRYGIHDGDLVKITSPRDVLEVKAKLVPGVMPDVLYMPFGLGHKAGGRFAKGVGVNPYEVFSAEADHLTGQPSLLSTTVRIEKSSGKESV